MTKTPQISVYHDTKIASVRYRLHNLGSWIDSQDFCSEELSEIFSAWSEGRLYYGGGGAAAAWAVKLYEPYDEDLDPWSDEVPAHAYA